MRIEWGDASLGIVGILGTVRIMGNVGASWDDRLGLHVAVVMGDRVQAGVIARGTRIGVEPGTSRTCRTSRTIRTGYWQKVLP